MKGEHDEHVHRGRPVHRRHVPAATGPLTVTLTLAWRSYVPGNGLFAVGAPVWAGRGTGTGELARCLQHETDHLRGELYIDKLTGDERRRIVRQVYRAQA